MMTVLPTTDKSATTSLVSNTLSIIALEPTSDIKSDHTLVYWLLIIIFRDPTFPNVQQFGNSGKENQPFRGKNLENLGGQFSPSSFEQVRERKRDRRMERENVQRTERCMGQVNKNCKAIPKIKL